LPLDIETDAEAGKEDEAEHSCCQEDEDLVIEKPKKLLGKRTHGQAEDDPFEIN